MAKFGKWWHWLIGAGVVGVIALGGLEVSTVPDNEKLVVPASDIIETKDIPAFHQDAYSYKDEDTGETVDVPTFDRPEIIEYRYKNKILAALKNENISQRTAAQMVFDLPNGDVEIALDAGAERIKDANGDWWTLGIATTTKDSYNKQVAPSQAITFISRFFIPHVYAQTFLTGGAGSGNQTWNVPADWNLSNNSIECIGAGGDGKAIFSGGGTGGGGGAYAKITNLSLTPGGTADYAIGAHASTTSSMLQETYFNSTASSTASLSCAFGNFATSQTATSTGGAVANSTGTTKYAGGDGAKASVGAFGRSGNGGGGSAGPTGAGFAGGGAGLNTTGVGSAGGGGGSNGGSATVGVTGGGLSQPGGNGGAGTGGSGGGAGGTADVDGAAGTSGGGGGGGYTDNVTPTLGGTGGCDTAFDATHGACGGGGGGGGSSSASTGKPGANGGTYGGGGGGAGRNGNPLTAGIGGQGIIVITYTPATTFTNSTPRVNVQGSVMINGAFNL